MKYRNTDEHGLYRLTQMDAAAQIFWPRNTRKDTKLLLPLAMKYRNTDKHIIIASGNEIQEHR
jgi:hypothetical protein